MQLHILICSRAVRRMAGYAAAACLCLGPAEAAKPELAPRTRAEATACRETSTFEDVTGFLQELQLRSDKIRVEQVIRTAEGRDVPLVIAGDPLPSSPEAARRDDRPVIFIQANIHAGEVEGKEAALMLLREMTLGPRQALLRRGIFLVLPIFNADSNEKISPKNRSYMPNPDKGVGARQNSQNYDLNRDYLKTESREVRAALERIILPWDPLVYLDLHTTDGSYHQETVTYYSPRGPNWDPDISNWLWELMYPNLARRLAAEQVLILPYGDFVADADPEKGWATFPPSARMGVDYIGLRNRFSILVENYAFIPFATRIEHCHRFLAATVEFVLDHSPEMARLARRADQKTAAAATAPAGQRLELCLKTEARAFPEPLTVHGYRGEEAIDSRGRKRFIPKLDQPAVYQVPYLGRFVCQKSRPLPWAYLLPAGCDRVCGQLMRHGIRVDRLDQPVTLPSRQFHTTSMKLDNWVQEGHVRVSLEGDWQDVRLEAERGFFIVRLDQPLARLAALLLEPDHDDSLAAWGFFNIWVTRQWYRDLPPLPVYRAEAPFPAVSSRVASEEVEF